jgi:hypothetical protein
LLACQSVLLQEQFHHALALLLDLLVSFAHNCTLFDDLSLQNYKNIRELVHFHNKI